MVNKRRLVLCRDRPSTRCESRRHSATYDTPPVTACPEPGVERQIAPLVASHSMILFSFLWQVKYHGWGLCSDNKANLWAIRAPDEPQVETDNAARIPSLTRTEAGSRVQTVRLGRHAVDLRTFGVPRESHHCLGFTSASSASRQRRPGASLDPRLSRYPGHARNAFLRELGAGELARRFTSCSATQSETGRARGSRPPRITTGQARAAPGLPLVRQRTKRLPIMHQER